MVTLILMGVVAGTVYLTLEVNSAYIKAKEFKKVQTKAKKPEHSRVNILV